MSTTGFSSSSSSSLSFSGQDFRSSITNVNSNGQSGGVRNITNAIRNNDNRIQQDTVSRIQAANASAIGATKSEDTFSGSKYQHRQYNKLTSDEDREKFIASVAASAARHQAALIEYHASRELFTVTPCGNNAVDDGHWSRNGN